MSSISDFDERSNKNMIHLCLELFHRIREKGVKTTKSNRNTLFKFTKLVLIFYDRETRRYHLTEYGAKLLKQVEKEVTNNQEVSTA
jgi:hypothetical protein